ncbi:serine-enriched protein-like isoform X2 [Branchiostoma lanceolatum]|uniref:BTBD3 protein n=1 Tax=Branchiostoma lanceolatum TaxID=7740 RepID=A0A8J9W2U1_BRALA|nr:BTBD3 [Branchiostoma lanceolatum]
MSVRSDTSRTTSEGSSITMDDVSSYCSSTESTCESGTQDSLTPGFADDPEGFSRFENKSGLAEDMKLLATMPELYDVTFLAGEEREPVYGIRAILAARSRVFHKLLFLTSPKIRNKKTSRHSGSFARIFSKLGSNDNLNMNSPDVIEVPDFDPDVFRDLMEYIHSGCVKLQPRTLIGLMNAAEFYGLEELRRACIGFLHCCISLDTVCPLLSSMEKYVHFKSTRSLMQKVLEFVDDHASDVLTQAPFAILPDHVVRLVLSRDVLQADEVTKFHAALRWARRYSDKHPDISVKAAISPLLDYIDFNSMSAMTLMKDIRATGTVPDEKLVTALAYQADPASVESMRLRNAARSPRRKRNNVTSQMAALSMSSDRLDDDVNSDVGESDSGNSSNDHDDGSLHYF